jgi:hypothetical protein
MYMCVRGIEWASYTHIHDRSPFKRGKIDTPYTDIHDRSPFKGDKIDTTYIHIHDRSFLKRDKIDTLTHIYMAASDSVVCFEF